MTPAKKDEAVARKAGGKTRTRKSGDDRTTDRDVCERKNLEEALKRVMANKGSPGVDGMTVHKLPDYLRVQWPTIRQQLLSGTYQSQPVKRVEIPKPDGGVRKLGIATVWA